MREYYKGDATSVSSRGNEIRWVKHGSSLECVVMPRTAMDDPLTAYQELLLDFGGVQARNAKLEGLLREAIEVSHLRHSDICQWKLERGNAQCDCGAHEFAQRVMEALSHEQTG
jgi:hypothetical protein